jgi:hypothetical protein
MESRFEGLSNLVSTLGGQLVNSFSRSPRNKVIIQPKLIAPQPENI